MNNTTIVKMPPEGIKPIGILHFLHGMAEHKERYEQTLSFFSARGYICTIRDMKGHGDNIVPEKDPGYLGENRVNGLIEDVHSTVLSLKHHYPNLPFYLAGHSMGSLLARAYCKKYDNELKGLIVIGCPSYNAGAPFGILLIRLMRLFHKETYISSFVQSLATGTFQKSMPENAKPNSWICTDETVIDQYNTDELCGFPFTLNGYLTLFELMRFMYSKKNWNFKNPKLPILFVSGAQDPCRISDKDFDKAVNLMKQIGYQHVDSKLYPDMRHEILNEPNRSEVWEDMLDFLTKAPIIGR